MADELYMPREALRARNIPARMQRRPDAVRAGEPMPPFQSELDAMDAPDVDRKLSVLMAPLKALGFPGDVRDQFLEDAYQTSVKELSDKYLPEQGFSGGLSADPLHPGPKLKLSSEFVMDQATDPTNYLPGALIKGRLDDGAEILAKNWAAKGRTPVSMMGPTQKDLETLQSSKIPRTAYNKVDQYVAGDDPGSHFKDLIGVRRNFAVASPSQRLNKMVDTPLGDPEDVAILAEQLGIDASEIQSMQELVPGTKILGGGQPERDIAAKMYSEGSLDAGGGYAAWDRAGAVYPQNMAGIDDINIGRRHESMHGLNSELARKYIESGELPDGMLGRAVSIMGGEGYLNRTMAPILNEGIAMAAGHRRLPDKLNEVRKFLFDPDRNMYYQQQMGNNSDYGLMHPGTPLHEMLGTPHTKMVMQGFKLAPQMAKYGTLGAAGAYMGNELLQDIPEQEVVGDPREQELLDAMMQEEQRNGRLLKVRM